MPSGFSLVAKSYRSEHVLVLLELLVKTVSKVLLIPGYLLETRGVGLHEAVGVDQQRVELQRKVTTLSLPVS